MIDSMRAGGAGLLQLEIGNFIETDPLKGSFVNPFILDQLEAHGPAAIVPGPRELQQWAETRQLLAGRDLHLVLSNLDPPVALEGLWNLPRRQIVTVAGVRVGLLGVVGREPFAEIAGPPELRPVFRDPAAALGELIPPLRREAELVVVMACMGDREAEALAERLSGVDLLFAGYETIACREAYRAGETVFTRTGLRGQYFSYVRTIVSPDGELVEWWGRNLRLDRKVPADPAIERAVAELEAAEARARTLGREADARRRGRPGERYLGVKRCRACHPGPYAQWLDTRHARASATLQREGHARDPECLRCHTTGYEHITGFHPASAEPDLRNVQCESCHGIGTEHRRGAATPPVAEATCRRCHTPEWSPDWAFAAYRARITH
ncbi:MAG: hypothetical protein GF330_13635 [Candidatus Eisenbacteria bacterium]|nr:hypothetical protein [Candidatus Eisenbacteria bacterium]